MIIKKEAKFYASHRNQDLTGKCESLHGHQYMVTFFFLLPNKLEKGVTTLFEDLEKAFAPVIERYDHAALWDKEDPLYQHIYSDERFVHMKHVLFDGPTSVENLCFQLFEEVCQRNENLTQVDVRETTTSVISFHFADYEAMKMGRNGYAGTHEFSL